MPLHILGNDRYAQFVPQHSALAALEDGALARRVAKADASPDSAAEAELFAASGRAFASTACAISATRTRRQTSCSRSS